MIIGLLLNLWGGLERALVTVSLIIGNSLCGIVCAVIVHHEWVQAGHAGQPEFHLHFSPSVGCALWLGTMLVAEQSLIVGTSCRIG